MPLGRGSGITAPPVETPGHEIPRETDPGFYVPTWITPAGPDGQRIHVPLNPPGREFFTLKAVAGLGATPIEHVTAPHPDGGLMVEFTRPKERIITWPVRVRASTHEAFLALWRQHIEWFTMTRRYGPGTLRLARPDGSAREIDAYYQFGWEQEPGDGAWLEDTAVLSLLCPDPFWRDIKPVEIERMTGTLADYLDPYPTISSGQVLGDTTLRNDGHADAWPSWEITGPMTSLTATNHTRNQSFVLTHTLTAGEVITMSTRPIQVRGPAGENLINALNLPTGKPWRLDPQTVSSVTFTVAGVGPGTNIRLSFQHRYETA